MPSLQALRDFKSSFDDIGGEKAALAAQNLPFEDLPFPETEAEIPDTSAEEAAQEQEALDNLAQMGLDPGVAASLGLPQAAPAQEEPAEPPPASPGPADNFDLTALLGSVPDDLGEIPEEDINLPGGLLEGLAGDLEQSPPDAGPDPGFDLGEAQDAGDFNLGDLGGGVPEEGLGGEDPEFSGEDPNAAFEGTGEFGETGETVPDLGEGIDFGDPGLEGAGLDLGGEALEEGLGGEVPEFSGEGPGASFEGIGEFGETGETAPDTDLEGEIDFGGPGLEGLDLGGLGPDLPDSPGEGGEAPEAGLAESPDDGGIFNLDIGEGFSEDDLAAAGADSFDSFDMEGSPAALEEEEEAGPNDADLGDFTLPGIDDMLGGIPGEGPEKAGKGRRGFFSGGAAEEKEPEEISLDETDLANLRRTLAAYPLNLRLAVEEIIAEKAIPPDQMADLVRLLVRGALPKETAALAGKILGKTIQIPRGFQKKTGEQMEEERGSFAYIFARRFLPLFALFLFIALVAASSFYLFWRFIYTPVNAENIYRLGYERIAAGEYEQANRRFSQAFSSHRDKKWFYRYAEAFRDQRQYIYAEEKYDELLGYYPRDKKGVLDYAAMETYYRRNYEKADLLIRSNILEFNPNDQEALLAQGDNAMAWGEIEPSRYEDARFAYARILERYGWTDPVAERMLRYFIRTDNLREVIPLQSFFMDNPKKKIAAGTLAELGGYLLDKRTEEVRGVPNEYMEQIGGVREVLLRAILLGPDLPEAHYHLSRYYGNLGSEREEQITLEVALRAFDNAAEESLRRTVYHIEALKRSAEIFIRQREYFQAEEKIVKAVGLYENNLERGLLVPSAQFGQLYAAMGDLEYFTKSGDMEMSLSYYNQAERNGYAPPEMLYRMGAAHYQQEEWAPALERFFAASSGLPLNRRILLALANSCYRRGDFYAAQGYYNRLLDILESERSRLPVLLPNDRPEYLELAERLMIARNNLGVTLEALARSDGNPRHLAQAAGYYVQSSQAWDALTRNPQTMIRLGAGDPSSPGINLAFLNSRNIIYPQTGYEPQLFVRIDKDVLEPSPWED
jgi:tetratricopeptide (TPR) repeat protein